MNDSPGALESLSIRMDELEKRVHALEHPIQCRIVAEADVTLPEPARSAASVLESGNIFQIIGRAMLGIAGAYVLRAMAEGGTLSKLPISLFAVAYAFGWLVWSARTSSSMARLMYAATSALILAPMLWENTLVFHVFTSMGTAGVLAAFLTLTTALELRNESARGIWIAQSVAAVVTAVLAFRTREVLPFVAALLIGVLVIEFAKARQYEQPLWPLTMLVTDVLLWGMIFIYSGPENVRAAYPPLNAISLIAPPLTLFSLNSVTVSIRALVLRKKITVYEVIQTIIAFALAAAAVLYFEPLHAPMILGLFCLMLSVCSYGSAFGWLRARNDRWSFRIFATWSAALLVVGLLWALPRQYTSSLLTCAGLAAIYLAKRVEPTILIFHGGLFLAAGAVIGGLPLYMYECLAGIPPHYPELGILIVALCASFALVTSRLPGNTHSQQFLNFVPALLAVCACVALLIHSTLILMARFLQLDVQHVAFLRTLTICVATIVIAIGGSRWRRPELTQLAYAALAFVGAKLLFDDLRHGHMAFIAGSIAMFAIALIATPRLVRSGNQRNIEGSIRIAQIDPIHKES